jgi:hypothetical protein
MVKKLEQMWTEAVMALLKVPSPHLSGWIKEISAMASHALTKIQTRHFLNTCQNHYQLGHFVQKG